MAPRPRSIWRLSIWQVHRALLEAGISSELEAEIDEAEQRQEEAQQEAQEEAGAAPDPFASGQWHVHLEKPDDLPAFDAVLIATHDASLAAASVRAACASAPPAHEAAMRLEQLAAALDAQRAERTAAVYTWSGYFPAGASEALPFDAVTVPGSRIVHFLARDASKPGRPKLVRPPSSAGSPSAAAAGVPTPEHQGEEYELWTAVSTSDFAKVMDAGASLARGERGDSDRGGTTAAAAASMMSDEVSRLLGLGAHHYSPPLTPTTNAYHH